MPDPRKTVVPVVSGNVKYFGMSFPEWVINIGIYGFLVAFIGFRNSLPFLAVQIVCIVLYIHIVKKLEENIFLVLLRNLTIPNAIGGHITHIIRKK